MTTFSVNSNLWALVPFTAHNLTLVTFLWKVVSRVLVSSPLSRSRGVLGKESEVYGTLLFVGLT